MFTYSRPLLIIIIFGIQSGYTIPISNVTSTQLGSNNSSVTFTQGWTPSPSGRGTIDIIWTCVVTMFLCSWSVLCLQIPSEKDTQLQIFWRRSWLTALCGLGPEITLQLALGQWSTARQSVRDFHNSKFPDWTMKHAFYAGSGGFMLKTPDFKPIPIDAKQLLYLINHKYVDYPTLSEHAIDAKNKIDVLLRVVSVGQITWFITTVIARRAQGLFVTGMELTTSAFILCSFGTTFCWWNKGADVAIPVILSTETTIVQILKDAGDAVAGPYHRTPLDFISQDHWHWSLYWTHWINILRKMHIVFAPKELPHDRLENTIWNSYNGYGSLPAFAFMCLAYSSIFIAGWDDHFPTNAERILWRISSLSMMITIVLYFVVTGFAYLVHPALRQYFGKATTGPDIRKLEVELQSSLEDGLELGSERQESVIQRETPPRTSPKSRSKMSSIANSLRNNSLIKDPLLYVPLKATLPMYVVAFFYCCSRTLILILDMIQLRSLPPSAFATVSWGAGLPHLS